MARHAKRLRALLLASLLVGGIGAATLAAPVFDDEAGGGVTAAGGYNPDREECRFLDLINHYRASKNEDKLKLSRPLGEASEDHTRDMVRRNKMYHTDNLLKTVRQYGYDGSYVGENVASGFTSAKAVFNAWQKSRDHKQNMLSGRFEAIGIAEQNGYWTTIFGDKPDQTMNC